MKAVTCTLTGLALMAAPAFAQQKVFGEAGLSYGQTDIDEVDDTVDLLALHGRVAFVSQAGLGVQLGGSYANLSVDGEGDVDTYTYDAHIYGDAGAFKAGAFVGKLELDEVEIYGFGAEDLDTSVTTYGLEGQASSGSISYHGYVAQADIDDTDNLLYGVGADFGVTPAFELTADYDAINLSVDGLEEEFEVDTITLGAGYYLDRAPVRLSALIGRTSFAYDNEDSDVTNFGIGATYLFGGRTDASRETLFEGITLPF